MILISCHLNYPVTHYAYGNKTVNLLNNQTKSVWNLLTVFGIIVATVITIRRLIVLINYDSHKWLLFQEIIIEILHKYVYKFFAIYNPQ